MKHILFSIALWLVSSFSIHAKQNVTAVYEYTFGNKYKFQYELTISDGKAHYVHHQEAYEVTTPKGYVINFKQNYYDWYHSFITGETLEQRELADGTPFNKGTLLYTEWPPLQWEITNETKVIAGYKVQKAVTRAFKNVGGLLDHGNAIAWFTTEIPYPVGPERYYGLPGLIVHLAFSEVNTTCTLKNIEFEAEPIEIPEMEGIEVSNKDMVNPYKIDPKWLKAEKKKLEQ